MTSWRAHLSHVSAYRRCYRAPPNAGPSVGDALQKAKATKREISSVIEFGSLSLPLGSFRKPLPLEG